MLCDAQCVPNRSPSHLCPGTSVRRFSNRRKARAELVARKCVILEEFNSVGVSESVTGVKDQPQTSSRVLRRWLSNQGLAQDVDASTWGDSIVHYLEIRSQGLLIGLLTEGNDPCPEQAERREQLSLWTRLQVDLALRCVPKARVHDYSKKEVRNLLILIVHLSVYSFCSPTAELAGYREMRGAEPSTCFHSPPASGQGPRTSQERLDAVVLDPALLRREHIVISKSERGEPDDGVHGGASSTPAALASDANVVTCGVFCINMRRLMLQSIVMVAPNGQHGNGDPVLCPPWPEGAQVARVQGSVLQRWRESDRSRLATVACIALEVLGQEHQATTSVR
jgi:hypothetical protein